MDGFFIIDKPVGLSSHDIVARIRRGLKLKKVGHTGTLDPFATGVLPVALGEGTKAIQFLDESVKEYRAVMRLGIATDTQDHTGSVISSRETAGLRESDLTALLPRFTGKLMQLPPMFSALKRGGVPLYTLARKGIEVEREARPVEIHSLTLEWIRLPEVCFTVRCSRGTYVRTLASDLGEALGCGAHLLELRRTASGLFREAQAITLDQLLEGDPSSFIFPVQHALAHLREVKLSPQGAKKVANGVAPGAAELLDGGVLPASDEQVRLSEGERLAAVGEYHPVKGMRLARVFH